MSDNILWWGYLYNRGKIEIMPYVSGSEMMEAQHSPFIAIVFPPFLAADREHAAQKIKEML